MRAVTRALFPNAPFPLVSARSSSGSWNAVGLFIDHWKILENSGIPETRKCAKVRGEVRVFRTQKSATHTQIGKT